MNKPNDFDTAKSAAERDPLPAGGYVCRIVQVQETKSSAGSDMIKIGLEIAEGSEKGRFTQQFKNDTRTEKKWPCIANQLIYATDGSNNTNPFFKSFITAVSESNSGFKVQWGEGFAGCFKNKLVGVIFRREQYQSPNDNNLYWSTKPFSFRNAQSIRDKKFTVPADKPYTPQGGGNNGYAAPPPPPAQNSAPQSYPADLSDFEEVVPEEDLPF